MTIHYGKKSIALRKSLPGNYHKVNTFKLIVSRKFLWEKKAITVDFPWQNKIMHVCIRTHKVEQTYCL